MTIPVVLSVVLVQNTQESAASRWGRVVGDGGRFGLALFAIDKGCWMLPSRLGFEMAREEPQRGFP